VEGNVLSEFKERNDGLMITVRVCVCGMVFFSMFTLFFAQTVVAFLLKTMFAYPLVNVPLRVTLSYQLFRDKQVPTVQHAALTIVPFLIALGISLAVDNVSLLFSFVGAVSRTSISMLFPSALMLRSGKIGALSVVETVGCWFLFVFGAVVLVGGLVGTVYVVA
jgi:hypothetical protein